MPWCRLKPFFDPQCRISVVDAIFGFDLRPKKMTLKAQIFPDFLTSEGDRFPTFGGIFSDLRWKSKNRIGNAYSIVLRSRKIPHMTKSVHWFGCRLWCYRFKSLHILYFRLFCRVCLSIYLSVGNAFFFIRTSKFDLRLKVLNQKLF